MDAASRFELITRNTAEVLVPEELKSLLDNKVPLKHYIGFEISGKVHLGTGLSCMSKVKDFLDAGVKCSLFLADWHSWINEKFGGDRDVIKRVGVGYFKEALKASLKCVGASPDDVSFVLGTDLYEKNQEFWAIFVDIAKNTSLARIMRSITIMGRKEGEAVDFAKLLYPPMQVADIFVQGLHIAHAGLDQRKAHVIAREVSSRLKIKPLLDSKGNKISPIAIHHSLILGLGKPPMWPVPKDKLQELWSAMKMSKSKPETCVFIHDSPEDIKKKISNSFCPETADFNPVLDWAKNLIFKDKKSELLIKRDKKFGSNKKYSSYQELEKDFVSKKLHPMDLKNSVADKIMDILEPARNHFSKGKPREFLEEVSKYVK